MLAMRTLRRALPAAAGLLCAASAATADPVVPGFIVEVYARLADPMMISFAPGGDIYAGRDNYGSGGGANDAVSIWRVAAADRSVAEFGAPVADPDAVLFDASGAISGSPGAVLVGGSAGAGRGALHRVQPGGAAVAVVPATTMLSNPNDIAIDRDGRAIFTDINTNNVKRLTAGAISTVFSQPAQTICIAVNPANGDVYVTSTDGTITRHSAEGALLNGAYAGGLGEHPTIALEPANSVFAGGGIGVNRDGEAIVYTVASGRLLRFDAPGAYTVLGDGFGAIQDIAFGPDGALYLSDFANDRILRIVTPEPSGLALLGLGAAFGLLRRRR